MVRAYFSIFAGVFAVTLATHAQAQILPADNTWPDKAAVKLRVTEPVGIRLELYDPKTRPPRFLPSAVCFDECQLTAIPGRYFLRVSGPPGSDVRTSKRYLDIAESSEIIIEPPSL